MRRLTDEQRRLRGEILRSFALATFDRRPTVAAQAAGLGQGAVDLARRTTPCAGTPSASR